MAEFTLLMFASCMDNETNKFTLMGRVGFNCIIDRNAALSHP